MFQHLDGQTILFAPHLIKTFVYFRHAKQMGENKRTYYIKTISYDIPGRKDLNKYGRGKKIGLHIRILMEKVLHVHCADMDTRAHSSALK